MEPNNNFLELEAKAHAAGLSNIGFIRTDQIIFNPEFRKYCVENRCGNYGINYACPPDCGTPEEMAAKVKSFDHALVMQTLWHCDDLSDSALLKKYKKEHMQITDAFIEQEYSDLTHKLIISAGNCSHCDTCSKSTGEPCHFPQKMYSCLSAYCIDAAALASAAGMNCWYDDGTVAYFSLMLY